MSLAQFASALLTPTSTTRSSDGDAVSEATGGIFGVISSWVLGLMDAIGAPGAGLAVFLENAFPPIPSEIILPLAGVAAQGGSYTIAEALFWTTLGSVVGAYFLYGLGRWLGHDRTLWLARKLPFIDEEDIDKTIEWFRRHGTKAVFFGRMLPIFRSFISVPAGIERMPLLRFGLLTLAGSAIWNTIFVVAGYMLGTQWEQILVLADTLKYVVYALIIALIVWFIWTRVRKYRRRKQAAATASASETDGSDSDRTSDRVGNSERLSNHECDADNDGDRDDAEQS